MDSTGRTPAPGNDSNDTPLEDSVEPIEASSDSDISSELIPVEDEPTQIFEPPAVDDAPTQLLDPATQPAPAHAHLDAQTAAAQAPDEFESHASLADIPTQASAIEKHTADEYDGYSRENSADWDAIDERAPNYYVPPMASPRRMQMSRRRRRYIFYIRHSVRARQLARSNALIRLAWASAILTGAIILTMVSASIGVAASYYQSQQSVVNALNRTVSSRDSVRVYDSKGVMLYQFSDNGAQHSISLAHVPITVVNATVAIEDRSFWVNQGIDFTSIVRAAVADIKTKSINQGGSTITQQLIKQNVLNSNETFDRKLREAILSIGMTTSGVYSKSQILEMYLNSIPYGQEAYGIDAAASTYFGYQDDPVTGITAAQQLTLAQASMLAGIPQNPNTNNPLLHPQHAHDRQVDVLNSMIAAGYITKDEMDAALKEAASPTFFHPQAATKNLAPHFVNFVRDQLSSMLQTGQLHLTRSGLNVYTTLDIDLQNYTQQAMKDHLYGNDPDDYGGRIRNDHLTNLAGMVVQHSTGSIRVMLGSVDYYSTKIDGQFNVLTTGLGRGPGSSFKPIVYAAAFSKGWFPGMTIADMPTVFWDSGADRPYNPLDFNFNEFWGNISLRTALQNSLNIPAVKVMQFAGVDDVRTMAMRMGVTYWPSTARWGLSSVLGTLDVHPYEMVQAYTVFANYGQYIPLHAIDKITDTSGDTLYQYTQPRPIQVMSPQVAFLVTNVLSDNFTRARDFGACSPLFLGPTLKGPGADCVSWLNKHPAGDPTGQATWPSPNAWPSAAKTGTGENFKDDWTLGYTMDFTGGFWGGNNDHSPMYHIDGITGAAPIWYKAMLRAEQGHPKTPFPVPSGVHKVSYTSNGITSTDWIIDGVTPPNEIGNAGPSQLPCIVFTNDPNSPWRYSSGPCQGSLIPGGGSPYRP